jgi:hypothetical protein
MVEGRVDFDGGEFCGVIREEVTGLHALGIEGSDPPFGCESRRANPKFGHGGKILRDWPAPGPCEAIKGSHLEIAGAKRIYRHLSGWACIKRQLQAVTAASRILTWRLSESGCRGRRLSIARRNLDRPLVP